MEPGINEYLTKYTDLNYLNKKEVMYRLKPPMTINEFWEDLLLFRQSRSIALPFQDQHEADFWFVVTGTIKERLETIDREATKNAFDYIDEKTQHATILNALIDEAFFSSVIEGAFSTRKKTAEMISKRAKPVNKSEQMIMNNYLALDYILENLAASLDEEMILNIFKIVTENTLDAEDLVNKYRNDAVYIMNELGDRVVYNPPHHSEVQKLMDGLVSFINTEDNIHPVIKACVIHFYLVYVHPFFDGNGRTARAISYMYLLKRGYNFFKFFSISSVINEEKQKYYKAIKDSEDYGADLTYFIDFYTRMIIGSIERITLKFTKEFQHQIVQTFLAEENIILSKRQKKIVELYIKDNGKLFSVEEYQKKFKISYETARTDLNQLLKYGLLKKEKHGKKYIYRMSDIFELSEGLEKA